MVFVEHNPSLQFLAELAATDPANPFHTVAYAKVRRRLGFEPLALAMRRDDGTCLGGCIAFLKHGYVNTTLEIPSCPDIAALDGFWSLVLELCHDERVSILEVDSQCSRSAEIPPLPGEVERRRRYEHVLDLREPEPWERFSANHIRNIRKATRAALTVREVSTETGCRDHGRLIAQTIERRRALGHPLLQMLPGTLLETLVETGAGRLFQAFRQGTALSSVMVLMARRGAYYHTAGTALDGARCGASHLLVHEIASLLRTEAIDVFNLSGAGPLLAGLSRFKRGFGCRVVELDTVGCFLGSRAQKAFMRVSGAVSRRVQQVT